MAPSCPYAGVLAQLHEIVRQETPPHQQLNTLCMFHAHQHALTGLY